MCKISVGDAARNDLICSVISHRFTVGSQVLWKTLSQCAALCCAVCPRSLKRPLYQRPSCVLVCGVVSRSAAVTREVRWETIRREFFFFFPTLGNQLLFSSWDAGELLWDYTDIIVLLISAASAGLQVKFWRWCFSIITRPHLGTVNCFLSVPRVEWNGVDLLHN